MHTADVKTHLEIKGKGSVTIQVESSESILMIQLKNVLFAPTMSFNVISVAQWCLDNPISLQCTDHCIFVYRYEVIPKEVNRKGVYERINSKTSSVPNGNSVDLHSLANRAINYAKPLFAVPLSNQNLYTFPIYVVFVNKIKSADFSFELKSNMDIPSNAARIVVLSMKREESGMGQDKYNKESSRQRETFPSKVATSEGGESKSGCNTGPYIAIIQGNEYKTKTGRSKLGPTSQSTGKGSSQSVKEALVRWHRRLGHPSVQVLKEAIRQVEGKLRVPPNFEAGFCDVCVRTKMTQKVYDKVRTTATRPGEVIFADLIGPIQPKSAPHNYRFILTVIDHFTRFAKVYVLRKKSETPELMKRFFDFVRSQFSNPGQIRQFRSDGGIEFVNQKMQNMLYDYGIDHQTTEPNTSPHNAYIERFNRTLEQKTRALLSESGFPITYWGMAVAAAEFLYNRTPPFGDTVRLTI